MTTLYGFAVGAWLIFSPAETTMIPFATFEDCTTARQEMINQAPRYIRNASDHGSWCVKTGALK